MIWSKLLLQKGIAYEIRAGPSWGSVGYKAGETNVINKQEKDVQRSGNTNLVLTYYSE